MGNDDKWRVPKRLDEPLKIWLFSPTEFMIFCGALLFGVLANYLLTVFICCTLFLIGQRKLVKAYGNAWFYQLCLWFLPIKLPGASQSWKRHYRG